MDKQKPDTQLMSLTDSSLECPICKNGFECDGKYQPKMLKCGHTFCRDCAESMSNPMGVKCPYCFAITPVGIMGIYGLPVNIALTTIVNNLRNQSTAKEEVAEEDLCCACNSEKAIKVCFSCDPAGCKLCEACCTSEHERGFTPVRNHRPILIKDLKFIPKNTCRTHHGQPYTHYSETTETFACQSCLDNLLEDVRNLFKPFDVVVHSSKERLEPIMKKLEKYLERVQESHHNISIIQSQLRQAGPKTIQDIQTQFAKFQLIFKERQKALLDNTEKYLSQRKEILGTQLSELRAITSSVINEKEKLRALMQQDDKDFLIKYRDAFQSASVLLDAENPALQRPVFEAEISVYVPDDFGKQLLTVGSVGGGPDIINFKGETVNGLLRLKWDVQETEHVKIDKYEIEYQLLPVSLDSEGPTSVSCNGQAFHYYVNPLRPGFTYTFRMRCSIYSGWGMWTTPFTARYDDFPCTISYIKKIVQIKIPSTGRYHITAKGAKAADGKYHRGGRGAIISAVFILHEGDVLDILCGGKSDCLGYHSGGGGGTFVSVNTRELQGILVIAGGGGGTRGADEEDVDGCDANLEPHGTMANATNCAEGGINGAPGTDAMFTGPAWGHGGAGWQQSSTTAKSFVDGGDGGECGGFGGGGGVGLYGGGGGGGFSGGGGGRGGGGGGSYVRADGDNVTKEIGHMDHGEVRIEKLPSDSSANNTNEIIILSHSTSSSSSSKEIAVLSPNNTSLSSTTEQ